MMREGTVAARGFGTAERETAGGLGAGDILWRVAAVVGEIDALKRERHATPVLDARAKLAEIYFKKRPGGLSRTGEAESRGSATG
jgi:hypothetical protein